MGFFLAYLEGCKMDDRVNLGVLVKDSVESLLVGQVNLVESGAASAELLDTVEDIFERVVEAVDDDNIVAVFEEGQGGEGANVAGATVMMVSPAMLRCLRAGRQELFAEAIVYPVTRTVPTGMFSDCVRRG